MLELWCAWVAAQRHRFIEFMFRLATDTEPATDLKLASNLVETTRVEIEAAEQGL